MQILLRPETDTDLLFLGRVYASARSDEMKLVPWDDAQKTAFLESQFSLQRHHYRQHYPNTNFDIIVFEGQDVGRIYVQRTSAQIELMEITVLPEYQRRGIAKSLFENLMLDARAAKIPIVLFVEQYNTAKLWYERLGFVVCGDTGVYLEMKWQPEIS